MTQVTSGGRGQWQKWTQFVLDHISGLFAHTSNPLCLLSAAKNKLFKMFQFSTGYVYIDGKFLSELEQDNILSTILFFLLP